MTLATSLRNPYFLKQFRVAGLFGEYDYDFPTAEHNADALSQLMILYGDNGTGKTTLLDTMFNLLFPRNGRGHRTALLRTKFRLIEALLSSGITVGARRKRNEVVGSYIMYVRRGKKALASFGFQPDADYAVTTKPLGPDYDDLMNELEDHIPSLHYLSDDRILRSTSDEHYLPTFAKHEPDVAHSVEYQRVVRRRESASIEEDSL